MKIAFTSLKPILIANAVLLSLLLLKSLLTTPAQAQQAQGVGSPGTYQLVVSQGAVYVIDTRDGTTKKMSGAFKATGHWKTDYKELQ